MKIGDYETHPAAELFPLMPEAELAELAQDILDHGLRLPITLCDGKILDGRNRMLACRKVQCPPRFEEFTGTSPTTWVLSMNLMRRHLTTTQKAFVAEKAIELFAKENPPKGGRPKKTSPKSGRFDGNADRAAHTVGVGRGYVEDAKAIRAKAPDVAEAAEAGHLTMPEAKSLAALPPEKRTPAIEKIKQTPEKSRARAVVKELALEEKQAFVQKLREEPVPLPGETYRVLVIDPPWRYDSRAEDVSHRGRNPYPDMSLDEIKALPVPSLAHGDSVLWLWTTNAFMRQAFDCLDAWGFECKTILTWDKEILGLGDWLRNTTEHCLLGVRGRPVVTLTNQTTLLHEKRSRHSAKPEAFYELIDSLCPGSKLELFARRKRKGWHQWGAEVAA